MREEEPNTDERLREEDQALMRVGFIGAGRMGAPMVGRLLAAGHQVTVLARTPEKRAEILQLGAAVAEDAIGFATADVVVLCVFTDDQVLEVCAGPLPAAMPAGATLIIHTTGSPRTAQGIAEASWEIMSSNDDFHAAHPFVNNFVRHHWQEFVGYARVALIKMLAHKPGTENNPGGPEYLYSQHVRDEIEEALLIDGAGKTPAPEPAFQLYPGDLVRHGSLH